MCLPTAEALQTYLHKQIPISKAIGVSIHSLSLEEIVVTAPFSPNVNHKCTVFGGSLSVVATLACWGLMYVNLLHLPQPHEIVISHANTAYLSPVTGEFQARCRFDDSQAWKRLLQSLARKGRARLQLDATIGDLAKPSVKFSGTFVSVFI